MFGDWRRYAACSGMEVELFFPHKGEPTAQIKEICATCVVRPECRDTAIANNEQFGVWGGMSRLERRNVRSAARQAR